MATVKEKGEKEEEMWRQKLRKRGTERGMEDEGEGIKKRKG